MSWTVVNRFLGLLCTVDCPRTHGTSKFSGRKAAAALEQPVEIRDIPKTGIECDFRNGCASMRVIQQIPGANKNPPSVDVLSDRATRGRKQLVHISLRAVEFQGERGRTQFRVIRVAIDIVKHHRQQDRLTSPLRRSFFQDAGRVRYQVNDMLSAEGRDSRVQLRTKTQFRMSGERPG